MVHANVMQITSWRGCGINNLNSNLPPPPFTNHQNFFSGACRAKGPKSDTWGLASPKALTEKGEVEKVFMEKGEVAGPTGPTKIICTPGHLQFN